ncbi:MAG: SDR family NAD(P)-dependent oxidoreductase [Candidatus Mcinerneyibacterium aminivorans]|uniref:SDR family NAD(P)-dependent oxidoreductase n=1 Tax=Candidatus Mcinerneyibacterium aminivorans TaxID=2703815 RepID=A0A5D0MJI3_9BACT|nr:MAG: SDR family NAD(P)-dependent oxidoreductase [Candidatus Mcinerneyibacterium aminivorans]
MKHVILTGASKGIGKALSENLKGENIVLHLIARSDMNALKEKIKNNINKVITYSFDLSRSKNIPGLIDKIFKQIKNPRFIALINNAATIKPIGPIGKISSREIKNQISLDLIAPAILSNEFIKKVKNIDATKRIINISSGASKDPYYGWGGYCASKAGIDILSKVIAIEQNKQYGNKGVEILSLAPGIVNTKMQEEIRKQPKENFIHVGKYIEYFKSDILRDPNDVAMKIIELLFLDFFPDGERMDINEL